MWGSRWVQQLHRREAHVPSSRAEVIEAYFRVAPFADGMMDVAFQAGGRVRGGEALLKRGDRERGQGACLEKGTAGNGGVHDWEDRPVMGRCHAGIRASAPFQDGGGRVIGREPSVFALGEMKRARGRRRQVNHLAGQCPGHLARQRLHNLVRQGAHELVGEWPHYLTGQRANDLPRQ